MEAAQSNLQKRKIEFKNIMTVQKPLSLNKGDTIGIVATARWIPSEDLDTAKSFWESKGYNIEIHPNNYSRHHEWGGDYQERADAFLEYWNNPNIKALFSATGGNRTLHLLDYIDFNKLKKSPKIIMGFSDTTALINAIYSKCGIVTFHGPSAAGYAKPHAETYFKETSALLSGEKTAHSFSNATILREGSCEGELIGGNMCIFNYLLGTPYISTLKNKILFLEDDGEEIRNIDRMLLNLRRLGKLGDIVGLMIGGFSNIGNTGSKGFPHTLDELLLEHTDGLDIPIIAHAPFSHRTELTPLPIGIRATLFARDNDITLNLQEAAVIK